ncbi:MAG: hypothetical protein EXQ84_06480 [Rhodospirillaceae bacterium]|nr:hypothetical protein [Rhodospirillaceae bacterium]
MHTNWQRLILGTGILLAALANSIAPHALAADPPWSPVEISVFETATGFDFANDDGIPFFTNDRDSGGKVICDDACTGIVWLPVWARASAQPMGGWSIVIRPDKAPQWAYKDKPVYNYNGRETRDEIIGLAKQDGHWHTLVP